MKLSAIHPPESGPFLARSINEQHHPALIAYAIGLCRHYKHDRTLANDLLQQFYCKVIISYESVYAGYGKWGISYLMKMIKRELFNVNRKTESMQRLAEEFCFRNHQNQEDTFYHLAPRWELDELLEECLSDKEYAIMLHYLQGYKLREIAELLNINPNTVGVHIHRAKAKLRKTLKE